MKTLEMAMEEPLREFGMDLGSAPLSLGLGALAFGVSPHPCENRADASCDLALKERRHRRRVSKPARAWRGAGGEAPKLIPCPTVASRSDVIARGEATWRSRGRRSLYVPLDRHAPFAGSR